MCTTDREGTSLADRPPELTDPSGPEGARWIARHWFGVVSVGSGIWYVAFIARSAARIDGRWHLTLFDDAMVSMRYAENLAHGHGLVWNAGGDHVEGITNLGWTLWMVALHLLPLDRATTPLLVSLTGVAILLANLVVVRQVGRRIAPGSRTVEVAAVVGTATFYPLVFWTLRGMEVGLLALLVDVAVLLALLIPERPDATAIRLGLVLAVAVLVRQDTLVLAGVVAAVAVWRVRPPARLRVALVVGGLVAGTLVALTLFRLAYYGDALPNTYYLKATGVALGDRLDVGWEALQRVVLVQVWVPVAAAIPGVVLLARGPARRSAAAMLAGLVSVQAAYSVWVGGDAWEYFSFTNRYLTTVAPVLYLLAAVAVGRIVRWDEAARRLAGALAVAVGLWLLVLWARGDVGLSDLYVAHADAGPWRGVLVATGLVAVVAGAVLLVGRPRRDRVARHGSGVVAAVAVTALVLSGTGQAALGWVTRGDLESSWMTALAEEGLRIRAATDERATVAVVFAGNLPYFAERESIDLLGKSDRHVARLPGGDQRFVPGHNKVDLDYSVGELRPDLVVSQFVTDEQLAPLGYHAVAGRYWVRDDTDLVDEEVLATPLDIEE